MPKDCQGRVDVYQGPAHSLHSLDVAPRSRSSHSVRNSSTAFEEGHLTPFESLLAQVTSTSGKGGVLIPGGEWTITRTKHVVPIGVSNYSI